MSNYTWREIKNLFIEFMLPSEKRSTFRVDMTEVEYLTATKGKLANTGEWVDLKDYNLVDEPSSEPFYSITRMKKPARKTIPKKNKYRIMYPACIKTLAPVVIGYQSTKRGLKTPAYLVDVYSNKPIDFCEGRYEQEKA